jgi:hypothetical protein
MSSEFYVPGDRIQKNLSYATPMLVVGTNLFFFQTAKPEIKQKYDLHILFHPSKDPSYTVTLVAFDRKNENLPFFARARGGCIKSLIANMLTVLESTPVYTKDRLEKRLAWINKWLYRLPKIPMRDILELPKL